MIDVRPITQISDKQYQGPKGTAILEHQKVCINLSYFLDADLDLAQNEMYKYKKRKTLVSRAKKNMKDRRRSHRRRVFKN